MKIISIFLCTFLFLITLPASSQKSNLDSLYTSLAKAKDDTNKVNTYMRICKELSAVGELDKGLTYLKSAQKLSQKLNFYRGLGNALTLSGRIYKRKNELDSALKSYTEGMQAREKAGNKREVCNSLNEIGHVYRIMGDYQKALETYSLGLESSDKIHYDVGVANNLMSIGNIHYKQGAYPEALKFYLRSLHAYEKADEKPNMVKALTNIGLIYDIQGDYTKALSHLQRALKIKSELNEIEGMSSVYCSLANVYFSIKDYKNCIDYNLKALEIAEQLNDKLTIANIYNNVGNVHAESGELEKALEYFRRSLKIREELKNEYGIAESFHQIASMLYLQKKYEEALIWSKKSMDLMQKMDDPELLKDIQQTLSAIYEMKKDGMNALKYYKEYISTRDTLFNEENTKKTIETQMNYDFEKKEAKAKLEQEKKDILLKEESEKQKIVRNSFIVGFMLMLMLAFFIFRGYMQKKKSNKEITHQKETIEEKQKEILDSINYALRIQETLLAHEDVLAQHLNEYFVLFKPKDIVSGDFYWATSHNNKFYIAICDSTGHGVPGAFMSLLNIGFLTEAIKEKNIEKPNEIFNYVRQKLIENVSKKGQRDGFDGILICIESKGKVSYAAAYNAPLVVSDNGLKEYPTDKMPVGIGENLNSFNLYTLELKKNDILYAGTDGYADQFGGPRGKKFKYKQLEQLIHSISGDTLSDQKQKLDDSFETWRGDLEQLDDVCVVGIKF